MGRRKWPEGGRAKVGKKVNPTGCPRSSREWAALARCAGFDVPEGTSERGTPIMVDGTRFCSMIEAANHMGCGVSTLYAALREGRTHINGFRVERTQG